MRNFHDTFEHVSNHLSVTVPICMTVTFKSHHLIGLLLRLKPMTNSEIKDIEATVTKFYS